MAHPPPHEGLFDSHIDNKIKRRLRDVNAIDSLDANFHPPKFSSSCIVELTDAHVLQHT